MKHEKNEPELLEQLIILAEEMGDLLFSLERRKVITETQSEYISSELDAIFKERIKKAPSLAKGD